MRVSLSLFLLILATPPVADAQPLYVFGEGPTLDVVWPGDDDARFDNVVGLDGDGYLYGVQTAPFINCWHPDDPAGTLRQMDVRHGHGTEWFIDPASMRLQLHRIEGTSITFGEAWCEAAQAQTPSTSWLYDGPYTLPAGLDIPPDSRWTLAPDGRRCVTIESTGLVCLSTATVGQPVTVESIIAVDELTELLRPDPGFVGKVVLDGPPVPSWRVRAGTYLPSGDLWAIASLSWSVTGSSGGDHIPIYYPYVLRQRAGTTELEVMTRLGPAPDPTEGPRTYPLDAVDTFYYEPTLDAVLAWPVHGWDWDFTANCPPFPQNGCPPTGPTGVGAWAFDVATGQDAYLRLTGLALRDNVCECAANTPCSCSGPSGITGLGPAPGGGVLVASPRGAARLTYDLDTLDIDNDTLSWAQEHALGTSDFTMTSDGLTTWDHIEVRLGLTPDDPSDDVATPRGPAVYAPSYAVQWHLPDALVDHVALFGMAGLITGGSLSGPLCTQRSEATSAVTHAGVCWRADGASFSLPLLGRHELHGYTENSVYVESADGTHVAWVDAAGIGRFFYASGYQDRFAALAGFVDLVDVAPTAGFHLFPIDEDRLFLASNDGFQVLVVYVERGSEPRLVYDHQKARCDSELGPCSPLPSGSEYDGASPHDLVGSPRIVGWNDDLEVLELLESGRYERYRVGIPATGDAFVIQRLQWGGLATQDLWGWLMRMPDGMYLSNRGEMHGLGSYRPTRFEDVTNRLANPSGPVGAWGDTLLHSDVFGGLTEHVRYTGSPQPGDALILAEGSQASLNLGVNLYRSGPRGGAIPLWPLNEWWGPDLVIGGMDVNANGTMCVADIGNRAVRHFVSPGGALGLTPLPVTLRDDLGVPIDCAMAPDDATFVLLAEEEEDGDDAVQRVVRIPPDFWADPELIGEIQPANRTTQIAIDVAGQLHVGPSSGVFCSAWGPCFTGDEIINPDVRGPWHHFAVRPNGQWIVKSYGGDPGRPEDPDRPVWLLKRNRGAQQAIGIFGGDAVALTILPGGEAVEPWTGVSVPLPVIDRDARRLATPSELSGGTPIAGDPSTNPSASSGDEGCSSGAGGRPGDAAVWALLALLLAAHARRAAGLGSARGRLPAGRGPRARRVRLRRAHPPRFGDAAAVGARHPRSPASPPGLTRGVGTGRDRTAAADARPHRSTTAC